MKKPYRLSEIFQISDKLSIIKKDDYCIIDNFYKYPDKVVEWIDNFNYPMWKYHPDSRNGIDYYDCHLWVKGNDFELYSNLIEDKILNLLSEIYPNSIFANKAPQEYRFNLFKSIKLPKKHIQSFPHYDTSNILFLVFLDKLNSGGTAIYNNTNKINFDTIDNEEKNLLFNVNNIPIKTIMESKFNRCIIFDASRLLHGAYIDDYKKVKDNWRITQIYSFDRKTNKIKKTLI
jgi:hypothetical protein